VPALRPGTRPDPAREHPRATLGISAAAGSACSSRLSRCGRGSCGAARRSP